MFSLTQILISAVTGGALSLVLLALYARFAKDSTLSAVDIVLASSVVALSILLWREAGNVGVLNDDPIPVVSPNDVLCPVVTFVSVSLLGGLRASLRQPDWPRVRALLTFVSLVVNIATI